MFTGSTSRGENILERVCLKGHLSPQPSTVE